MDIQPSTTRRSGCLLMNHSACRRLQISVFISVITMYSVYLLYLFYQMFDDYMDYLNRTSNTSFVNGDFEEKSNGLLAEKVSELINEEFNQTQVFNESILSQLPRYCNGGVCISRYCTFRDLMEDGGFILDHPINQTQSSSRNESILQFKFTHRCKSPTTRVLLLGQLRMMTSGSILVEGKSFTRFCLDFVVGDNSIIVHMCHEDYENNMNEYWYEIDDYKYELMRIAVLMIQSTSILCMIATIIIYASTPKLFNFHGKIIISYLVSVMISYIYIAFLQVCLIYYGSNIVPNKFWSYLDVISHISLITWLSIMSFDIWFVFSHPLDPNPHLHHDNGRFKWFSIGAWSNVLFHTILYTYSGGIVYDGFRYRAPLIFTIFVCILNGLMFLSTIYNYCLHNVNILVSNRHGHSPNSSFKIYTRLYFLMGIDWLVVMACFIYGGPTMIDIGHLVVDSQGFIMFVLLVCNRRVLSLLREK